MPMDPVSVCLKVVIATSLLATTFFLLGAHGFTCLLVAAASTLALLLRNYQHLRTHGILGLCSSRMRAILLERSLLDIFRDLVYFPYITKIIGFFLSIATLKPNPQELPSLMKNLPKEVAEISTRKGLLSLTPARVEELVLPANGKEFLPNHYGQIEEQWDRMDEYIKVEQPPHKSQFEQRFIHFLDSKMGWSLAVGLVGVTLAGAHQMRFRKFRKMMMQNATFCCLLLSILAVAVKLRKRQHNSRRSGKRLELEGEKS